MTMQNEHSSKDVCGWMWNSCNMSGSRCGQGQGENQGAQLALLKSPQHRFKQRGHGQVNMATHSYTLTHNLLVTRARFHDNRQAEWEREKRDGAKSSPFLRTWSHKWEWCTRQRNKGACGSRVVVTDGRSRGSGTSEQNHRQRRERSAADTGGQRQRPGMR